MKYLEIQSFPKKTPISGKLGELAMKKMLKADGYNVIKNRDNSGYPDLTAIKKDSIEFIEVKTYLTEKSVDKVIRKVQKKQPWQWKNMEKLVKAGANVYMAIFVNDIYYLLRMEA